MKHTRTLAALALLVFITACSSGGAPSSVETPPRVSLPDAPSSSADQSAAPSSSAPATPAPAKAPDTPRPPSGANPAQTPVLSVARAFYLVGRTAEAQEVRQRLGSRMVMVNMSTTLEAYHVSVGENSPERVRFEMHFTVTKADGTVRYTDMPSGQVKLAAPAVSPRSPAVEEAEALLGRGETGAALELLSKPAREKPTADIWNLISYAHLISGQWQASVEAGQKALELDYLHPSARYNTGMAELELKQYPDAIKHLQDATVAQPERPEPWDGLVRAYLEMNHYAFARKALLDKQTLVPNSAGAAETKLSEIIRHVAPADLTTAAKVRLEDGRYTIYLYPTPGEGSQSPDVVYLTGPEGVVGLPVGGLRHVPEWATFQKVDLPGGAVGYFLPGESVGAHVSGSVAYRLFVRSGEGKFRQATFVGAGSPFVPAHAEFIRSMGTPKVQGNTLVATYGDDAAGKTTIKVTWQWSPDDLQATKLEEKQENYPPYK